MGVLGHLEPGTVWKYFEEICQIPRPSRNEGKILAYLIGFAKKHKLEWKQDAAGNLLISKPASYGFENRKNLVLQSHVDMVGEKHGDYEHDFHTDPLRPYIENGWVKAVGTTLGADDGIGVAAQLALLAADDMKHGPIECLFTVDEESGMTGAFGLKPGFFTGKILLNLDSEDEGEFFIGCAGGMDTIVTFIPETEPSPEGLMGFQVRLTGLQGGHSGDEIEKGLGNSLKILGRFLWEYSRNHVLHIASFEGGNMRNAIPREASAVIALPPAARKELIASLDRFESMAGLELGEADPDLRILAAACNTPEKVYTPAFQERFMSAIYQCPHGVIAWSNDVPGLVETSTNLASLKHDPAKGLIVTTSQRSSVDASKLAIAEEIKDLFEKAGGKAEFSEGYPGWKPNPDSDIVNISKKVYRELFGTDPVVRAIHAGLECGLFLQKYPSLDMISFGPTIKGAHTPEERLLIESTDKFWRFLSAIICEIPDEAS